MGKYYITGNAGTGKSSVILALQARGFNAYDVDELPDVHEYLDTQTNTILDTLPPIKASGAESFSRYSSTIKESELKKLLDTDGTLFLGGSVTNQVKFYPLFDMIFGLVLAGRLLEARLADRTNNPTGNDPADRAYLLSINGRVEANLKKVGAVIIDASQPLDNVVDEILAHTN